MWDKDGELNMCVRARQSDRNFILRLINSLGQIGMVPVTIKFFLNFNVIGRQHISKIDVHILIRISQNEILNNTDIESETCYSAAKLFYSSWQPNFQHKVDYTANA